MRGSRCLSWEQSKRLRQPSAQNNGRDQRPEIHNEEDGLSCKLADLPILIIGDKLDNCCSHR